DTQVKDPLVRCVVGPQRAQLIRLLQRLSPPPPLKQPPQTMATSLLLSTTTAHPRNPKFLSSSRSPSLHPRRHLQVIALTSSLSRLSLRSPPLEFAPIRRSLRSGSTIGETEEEEEILGEDSAAFELGKQKLSSWIYFTVVLGVVLFVLDVVWIDEGTGVGKGLVEAVERVSGSPEASPHMLVSEASIGRRLYTNINRIDQTREHHVAMLSLTLIFALVHSGLASLRDVGEKLIGERAFRVIFAGVSLPLALSTVVYFINHRYDGIQLWQLQSVPGLHQLVWFSSFVSFVFLYPSTFNLLEVAAVEKPKMHLWETGIMRITRHPQGAVVSQMVGQVIWCLAHTLWIGSSVAVAASIGLIGHHLFGVWNGDRRLAIRYGEAFERVKSRTSIMPFAAIFDGRQKLPKDYYREFLRVPYLTIIALTLGTYFAHPIMQASSYKLHW
ncbi:15-cis-zeta-carotene isomerase, chloroplastic-like protein, partial [Drosera capensis]